MSLSDKPEDSQHILFFGNGTSYFSHVIIVAINKTPVKVYNIVHFMYNEKGEKNARSRISVDDGWQDYG